MKNALDTWLKETGTPALHLARAVKVSAPYVCDLRRDRRTPSREVATRIELATAGSVPVHSWFLGKETAQ